MDSQSANTPFFSPDGGWIGFYATPELKKIPAAGGIPVTVATLSSGMRGASWGADGTIIFGERNTRALHRVPAAGGEPEVLLDPDSVSSAGDGAAFWFPEILPGGKAVLFTNVSVTFANTQIAVLDLESSEVTSLISQGTHPRYASTGHIVYGGGDGTLRAVPFDLERLELTGAPAILIDGVLAFGNSGATGFAVAENGSLAYVSGDARTATRRLVWVDRTGREELVGTEAMTFDHPRLSPDGRRVAVRVGEGNADVHVVDLDRGTVVRLTRAPEEDTSPVWSADGSAIVFGSFREGGGIFKIASDGTGVVERLTGSVTEGRIPLPHAWSRNDAIVFYESGGPVVGDIYSLALESNNVDPLLASPDFVEAHPALSPDGRFLAYTGNESGRLEVYVRPFPNVDDARFLISPAGGNEPLFSPDGTELFYWDDATSSMMVVPVTLEPSFRAGAATRLFEGQYLFPRSGRHYDVALDGQRFLMIKSGTGDVESSMPPWQIVLVQNWFVELERLVPTGPR